MTCDVWRDMLIDQVLPFIEAAAAAPGGANIAEITRYAATPSPSFTIDAHTLTPCL